jgi:hypothetical protein
MIWRRQAVRLVAGLCTIGVLSAGCVSVRELAGFPAQSDPSVTLRATEPKWLLIKNPRFGDVASEPEYIWVEEDKIPTSLKTLVLGKNSIIAPPSVVAKYGSPPGGGRISSRQGGAYKIENLAPTVSPVPSAPAALPSASQNGHAPSRGYVVYVDTTRFVIDLAGPDGVRPGTLVSVRRDKIAIVHPITNEMLGELDEEIASGKVIEVRDKFSVVEIENLPAGAQIKVKDRCTVR